MPDDAVASLTRALVESNDRLLGLLGLVTNEAPPSFETAAMIDWVLDRAAPILDLGHVHVILDLAGGPEHEIRSAEHVWHRADHEDLLRPSLVLLPEQSSWSSTQTVRGVGELTVRFERGSRRFDTGDTKLLSAVSTLVGNAVATGHMYRARVAQELIAEEHRTAASITALALPDPASMPQVDSLNFFCDLVPAREAGGDLYTWREIDGDVWFAMGDVSGKGLPAAVLMSTVISAIEGSMLRHSDGGLVAVIDEVDRWVHQRLSDASMFVTMAIGRWSPATGELEIVNSGHSPIVFCRAGTSVRVEATAPPLGVVPGMSPTAWTRQTAPGDVLVLATDGFTEQQNLAGDQFGEDRFDRSICALGSTTAAAIGNALLDELVDHGLGCEQSDDRALMVLHFS